jgi:hypothetical protein
VNLEGWIVGFLIAAVLSSSPLAALGPQGPAVDLPYPRPLGVLPTADDGYLVFWLGEFRTLRVRAFDASGVALQPQLVLGAADKVSVTDESEGLRRLVWNAGGRVRSLRFDRRGRRAGEVSEFNVRSAPGARKPQAPRLLRLPDRSGLVVWMRGSNGVVELRGRFVDAGFRPRSEEFSVASVRGFENLFGEIAGAVGDDGRVILGLSVPNDVVRGTELMFWDLPPGARRARRIRPAPGGAAGPDIHQSELSVVRQADGTFLAVWQRSDAVTFSVHVEARHLDAQGNPLGGVVRITPAGEQDAAPLLVANPDVGATLLMVRGQSERIVAQTLLPDGQPVGGAVRIDDGGEDTVAQPDFLGQRADDPGAPLWATWEFARGQVQFGSKARRIER